MAAKQELSDERCERILRVYEQSDYAEDQDAKGAP
jgi:hypothetical protein